MTALPPIPDPDTGLPRPPHAPGPRQRKPSPPPGPDAPPPPPDQGPVLAWHRDSLRAALIAGLIGFVAAALLLSLRDGFQFRWLPHGELWAGLVVIGVLVALTQVKGGPCTAGAQWLRGRRNWVRIYELVLVNVSGWSLCLVDADGRSVRIMLLTLRADPLLWDLVYHGILHSVTSGNARTNAYAQLKLPDRPRD